MKITYYDAWTHIVAKMNTRYAQKNSYDWGKKKPDTRENVYDQGKKKEGFGLEDVYKNKVYTDDFTAWNGDVWQDPIAPGVLPQHQDSGLPHRIPNYYRRIMMYLFLECIPLWCVAIAIAAPMNKKYVQLAEEQCDKLHVTSTRHDAIRIYIIASYGAGFLSMISALCALNESKLRQRFDEMIFKNMKYVPRKPQNPMARLANASDQITG